MTLAAPVLPPKQAMLVCEAGVTARAAAGWVMVTLCVAVQPLASVAVRV